MAKDSDRNLIVNNFQQAYDEIQTTTDPMRYAYLK